MQLFENENSVSMKEDVCLGKMEHLSSKCNAVPHLIYVRGLCIICVCVHLSMEES